MNNNQESPKTQRKNGAKNSEAGTEILRYILVGIANISLGFGLISLFTLWGLNYVLSNFLGYFLGMVCSFLLHRHYTFRSQQRSAKTLLLQFLSFIAGNGICYGANLLTLIGLVELARLPAWSTQALGSAKWGTWFAQGLSVFVYVVLGFLVNKFIVFAKRAKQE